MLATSVFRAVPRPERSAVIGALLVLVLLAPAASAAAVVVELTNGQRIEGVLRQASSARVLVEAGGELLIFETADVRAIYFTAPDAAPAPPPAAAAPDARPAEPVLDPLEAVKALRAAVAAGTTAREYSPRVGEARAAVDRYLASAPGDSPPGADALTDAMRYYEMADFAWRNHSVTFSTVWLQKDDALARCEAYREFAEQMQAQGDSFYSERTRTFVLISDGVLDVIWSCAAERVDAAEQAFPKSARARAEPARAEPAKPDGVKAEPAKAEAARPEPPTADISKIDRR